MGKRGRKAGVALAAVLAVAVAGCTTGMPAEEILDAILEQGVPKPREFTHNMQSLHQIRKEL